jgi:hypothetical protein
VTAALQLAEMLLAGWVLWRLSAWCYRDRVPRDPRRVDRWPVEAEEPAAPADQRADRGALR